MLLSSSVSIDAFVVEPSTTVSPSTDDRSGRGGVALLAREVADEAGACRRVLRGLDRPGAFPAHVDGDLEPAARRCAGDGGRLE
jgi:hypothetical protein